LGTRRAASSADPALFLVGVNRSGTTLLSLMLDSHSRIAIPYESNFMVRYARTGIGMSYLTARSDRVALVTRILEEPFVREWDEKIGINEIDIDECCDLRSAVGQVYRAYARRFGKDIWGDKTPAYIVDLEVINGLFPDCRFIHIIRDGRDVAASAIRQTWVSGSLITSLMRWERSVWCARKMLRMLADERHIELRYEDLVADPEGELRRITDFLGIAFEPGMIEDYSRRSASKFGGSLPGFHVHLAEKPSLSQTYKWMKSMSRVDQAIAHELAGPLLAELGYPQGATDHPFRVLRKGGHRLLEAYRWRVRDRLFRTRAQA
jgi:hypothetical protein